MKITKVNIREIEELNDGLDHIIMERLGSIVLIAGKNGSGKTRLLNKIKYCVNNRPTNVEVVTFKERKQQYENAIKANADSPSVKSWEAEIDSINKRLNLLELIELSDQEERYTIVEFVPKILELTDCNSLSKRDLVAYSDSVDSIGISSLSTGTFARIQHEQDRYWNVTHQFSDIKGIQKNEVVDSYNSLKEIISVFLGSVLTRSTDGDAQIFGISLGKTKLSDGQKVLLQLCLAIHAQGASLNNLILLMDEPENHLHPSVLIEVVDKIRDQVNEGQLWIATHSITLLSHLDTSYIWYMDNNKIKYSGRQPEKVLKGLLGDDEQISRLADFLSLPAQFASNQFAYEALFEPVAVQTDVNDNQTAQIKNELRKYNLDDSIRVLDYGAGKGRLADSIYYSNGMQDKDNIHKRLDYIAFDPFAEDKQYCEAAICRIYDTSERRYFNDESSLLGEYDENSFDIIVMCNVLHEINPKDWLRIFSNTGTVIKLLKDNGSLLLVEDQLIPVGEKPHQNGFLVLSLVQLKRLFKITEEDSNFRYSDAKNDKRLMAYQVPKQCLMRISSDSRKEAIEGVIEHAKNEIRRLRVEDANYKNGKLHGFWTQQFANAHLCLDEL